MSDFKPKGNIEWKFKRLRDGKAMAEGGRVHADTFVEAEIKVKRLFNNDLRETFTLLDAWICRCGEGEGK